MAIGLFLTEITIVIPASWAPFPAWSLNPAGKKCTELVLNNTVSLNCIFNRKCNCETKLSHLLKSMAQFMCCWRKLCIKLILKVRSMYISSESAESV